MMENFNNTFVFEPYKQHAAVPTYYKPDIDTADLFNDYENAQYWKCISEMQWAVTLGQIDIMYDNVVLSW